VSVAARLVGFVALLLGVLGVSAPARGALRPPKHGMASCELEPQFRHPGRVHTTAFTEEVR
jgi:hypothetical protein